MEDNNDHWIESKDSHFKIDQFYRLNKDFRKIELGHMLISIAANGGPIALTSDKKQILALRNDDPSLENVCIFTNDGELLHKIKIDNSFREIIVSFEFLQDELLMVLFEKGIYWIVDPFKGSVKKFDIRNRLSQDQMILQGKVFENGFAFLTDKNRFFYIKNCLEPFCMEFRQADLKSPPIHWIVVPPKQIISEKVEIHMTHPTAGIIQLVEDQGLRIYYNKKNNQHLIENQLPEIKFIKFISTLSANNRFVAYFSAEPIFKENPVAPPQQGQARQNRNNPPPVVSNENRVPDGWIYRIIIISVDFQASYLKIVELKKIDEKTQLDSQKRPLRMTWCGDDAVVIQYQNSHLSMVFLDNGDVIRIDRQRAKGEQYTYMQQELDGIRLLTREKNKILRKIPQSYVNVFEPLSQRPASLLYSAYTAFQQKQPLQDDEIRNNKADLAVAVVECINAAKFEQRMEVAIQLMKAASYGKSFLQPNQISNNIIQQVCKNLRVLSQLRMTSPIKRVMTYSQFQSISQETLLKVLLRYNMHYIAFQIYRYLKKTEKFRIHLYTHWACCKVDSNESDEAICNSIRAKLSTEKGVSFTEIAHKAIESAKTDLALKLLQYQPSLSKKVPLLLWMGTEELGSESLRFFQKALSDAELSKDPNLLCLVIQKIRMSGRLMQNDIFELFSQSIYAKSAMISYYRIFDPPALSRYYEHTRDRQMSGIYALLYGIRAQKYDEQLKFMAAALDFFKQEGKEVNLWRRETLNDYISLYTMFIKNHPKVVFKSEGPIKPGTKDTAPKPGSVNEMLQKFMAKGNLDAVDDFKSQFKIPDKRVILTRIKIMIDQGKFQQLENFVEKNMKKHKIPVEMIADLLMKKREDVWALRMISKMTEKQKDEQYMLLQRIGKIKEAITLAAQRKDIETLEEIKRTLLDPELMSYVNEKLNSLSKK